MRRRGAVNKPVISIIMPNYNGAKYLELAIESFFAEKYSEKELIVVDGKSVDGSHEIISRYCDEHENIKWLKVNDNGISDAINTAIDVASGEIIGYLGSDDLLSGDTFRAIARWEPYVDFDAIFFNSYTYYVNERRCVLQRPPTLQIDTESLLYRGTIVGLQNTFYRRRIFDQVRFNINNRYSMDYEMLLEAAARKCLFFYVDSVATLNHFDGNISHNNEAQALEAAYVARRFCGEYTGVLFGEDLLPEEDRRQISDGGRQNDVAVEDVLAEGVEDNGAKIHMTEDVSSPKVLGRAADMQAPKASVDEPLHASEVGVPEAVPARNKLTSIVGKIFRRV